MQIKDEIDAGKFHIGVVGGGDWGTALANLLASKSYSIDLWVFEKEVKDQIKITRFFPSFLAAYKFSSALLTNSDNLSFACSSLIPILAVM